VSTLPGFLTPSYVHRYCLGIPDRGAQQGRAQAASAPLKKSPWRKYDDDIVTQVSVSEVIGSEAYILM
jgi:hypothetical protein